jgi:hypothetical protein
MPFGFPFKRHLSTGVVGLASCAGLMSASIAPAHALPSFARQTGEECTACHIGAFGPQLTAHGMKFKLEGYTESNAKSPMLPVSGMVVGSYGHTKKDPEEGGNNKKALQEVSAFLAGKMTDHLGAFVQATTSSDEHGKFSLDNVDLRYARTLKLKDDEVLFGVTLNNNPTVSDVFNTVPAWRFPYMSAEMVEPAGSPLLNGGLEMQVAGLTAYALWNDSIYAELGGYRSLSKSFLDKVNVEPGDKIGGVAPYWRLAYMKDNHADAWSVGVMGLDAKLHEGYDSGPTDKYHDIGIDASYQYLGNRKNIFTANASYIHERRDLDLSDPGNKVKLKRFDLAGSYHYDQTYGATLGMFDIRGDGNEELYGGSPNTRGYIMQADWTPFGKESSWGAPWANLRLGLQYTAYDKFNGESQGASDHNTLYAFVWTAF